MELYFLFFVVEGAVTFVNNSMFSLELLLGLVFSTLRFDVWVSSWRFGYSWRGVVEKIHDCVCRYGTLK